MIRKALGLIRKWKDDIQRNEEESYMMNDIQS